MTNIYDGKPFRIVRDRVLLNDPVGTLFCQAIGDFSVEVEGRTKRIAACLNACAGIPTDALEAGVVSELVHALENLHRFACAQIKTVDSTDREAPSYEQTAHAVTVLRTIAKAKGE